MPERFRRLTSPLVVAGGRAAVICYRIIVGRLCGRPWSVSI